jgi:hypothetical protein
MRRAAILVAFGCAVIGGVARGDDAAAPAADPGWELSFSPYLWATAMTGDVSARGVEAEIDMRFSDIVKQLNLGVMGKLEARRGNFIVALDGIAALLSEDDVEAGPRTVGFGPRTVQGSRNVGPRGGGQATSTVSIPRVNVVVGPAEADVEMTQVILGLSAGWRLFSEPVSGIFGEAQADDPRRIEADVFAGGRYWYLKTEIDLKVPPVVVPGFNVASSVALEGPRGRSRSQDLGGISIPGLTFGGIDDDFEQSADWIDPVVGVRLRADLTPKIGLTLLGDVGGFGIGSASTFTWQAMGMVNYRLGERWTMHAGYRALSIDRDASMHADIVMHGVIMGATWHFWP